MSRTEDTIYAEYLDFLYNAAAKKHIDANDVDDVVQESMIAYIVYEKSCKRIDEPKALLNTLLQRKYNDLLRKKYKNAAVSFDVSEHDIASNDTEKEQSELLECEYENVRRQISRLIGIYREVVVRRYVHGQSVDTIAAELRIPRGTVLSRLSVGRAHIKNGITKMEKYSTESFEPKKTSLGIWGSSGLQHEPFSLLATVAEGNILVLAYDKPVSIGEIADALGMPVAYVEPLVEKLVNGELMGKTPSGLVYTRCFVRYYKGSFGDIPAQEALADKYAERVWSVVSKHMDPLTKTKTFVEMTEKQKGTMCLRFIQNVLGIISKKVLFKADYVTLPERPDAGKWLATLTVYEHDEKYNKYEGSGPVHVGYGEGDVSLCSMKDAQTLFGDAHWAYAKFRYKCSLSSILRFYASFLPCGVKPDNNLLYELIPDFEQLHILRRDENGEIKLDIPALPFDEIPAWDSAAVAAKEEVSEFLLPELLKLVDAHKNKVPPYVDRAESFIHDGALSAYVTAQLLAIVSKGIMPYKIEVGKTPIIVVAYKKHAE